MCMGEVRNTFQILVGKYQWRVLLGVLRCRWKDDIKMDIKEISLDFGLDSWGLGVCDKEPSGSIKGRQFLN